MEIKTISAFNHDQQKRVSNNTTVGATLGAAAGAAGFGALLQRGFQANGMTDSFVSNVKNFVTTNPSKTVKGSIEDKIKDVAGVKDKFLTTIANSKVAKAGLLAGGLILSAIGVGLLAGKEAKNHTELQISKEILNGEE